MSNIEKRRDVCLCAPAHSRWNNDHLIIFDTFRSLNKSAHLFWYHIIILTQFFHLTRAFFCLFAQTYLALASFLYLTEAIQSNISHVRLRNCLTYTQHCSLLINVIRSEPSQYHHFNTITLFIHGKENHSPKRLKVIFHCLHMKFTFCEMFFN